MLDESVFKDELKKAMGHVWRFWLCQFGEFLLMKIVRNAQVRQVQQEKRE